MVAPDGSLRRARELRFSHPGYDRNMLAQIGGQGWLALRLSEDAGGAGLGVSEFCVLAEEFGARLAPEPALGAIAMSRLLRGQDLDQCISGAGVFIPAWRETGEPDAPKTRYAAGRVSGVKHAVYMADGADAFVVSTDSGAVLLRASSPGVRADISASQDGGNIATLHMNDAPAELLNGDMDEALDELSLATSAYLLGVIGVCVRLTLDYLRERRQFGKPIGAFQALQHRAADMFTQRLLLDASIDAAARAVDAGSESHSQRRAAVSRAYLRAVEASLLVTREAIQLHGAIGYTDEHDLGLLVRKALTLRAVAGSAAAHRRNFATSAGLFGATENAA